MATYASIKYDMDLSSSATGAGALTLLSTQTASSSATLSFTSGIDSTYDEYVFKFYDIHPSAVQTLHFNASVDAGSNYNVSKTTTYFRALHDEADSSTSLAYVDADLANGTGTQRLSAGIDTANDASGCGTLQIFNPSSTTFVKHYMATTQASHEGDYSLQCFTAGYFNTTSAIDAIQFKMHSGNIDAGDICLYGIK